MPKEIVLNVFPEQEKMLGLGSKKLLLHVHNFLWKWGLVYRQW